MIGQRGEITWVEDGHPCPPLPLADHLRYLCMIGIQRMSWIDTPSHSHPVERNQSAYRVKLLCRMDN